MIIYLKGANFSSNNIGTLNTWLIQQSISRGASSSNTAKTVTKGDAYSTTITIAEGYELGAAGITVTMGGTDITSTAVSGLTISIASVTGNVKISVPTVNTATGEEEEPDTPDTPTSTYTLTIKTIPSTATVTLTAPGYSQSGNSISVPSGTVVTYTTAADKYNTRRDETITVTEDTIKEVALASLPYASDKTIPADGFVPKDMFIALPDTWLNGSGTTLDQIVTVGTGSTIGYNCCYLPIDISSYTNIDFVAQTNAACYYQFFTTDGKWTLTGVRQKVDKGTPHAATIPAGAKYLVVAESRTNSTDANAVNGYLEYFPVSVHIS